MRPIDADALIEALGLDQYNNGEGMTSTEEWIAEAIMTAPTIEAEPVRRGKWLITPYTDYDDTYECSVCGHGWVFVEGTPKENDANYCPNCGALMEE